MEELYQNIGLMFFKHYYRNVDFSYRDENTREAKEKAENNKNILEENNAILFNSKIKETNVSNSLGKTQVLELKTIYPGLLSGVGYEHESAQLGELKLGFYFDYTTGLPCIPGSLIKGVIRSAFEHLDYIKEIIEELAEGADRKSKLKKEFADFDLNVINEELVDILFGTEDTVVSVYKRDIFFDAFPVAQKEHLLGNDFIAPHSNPLKNPVPLQFLKVMPEVTFQINFKLTDNGLNANLKLELYKQILLDLGLGAKTNVGYGQLEFVKPVLKRLKEYITASHYKELQPDSNKEYKHTVKVLDINDTDFLFGALDNCKLRKPRNTVEDKFQKDAQKKIEKGKKGIYKELAVGDEVEIRVNKENKDGFNFTVLPIWLNE